MSAAYLFVINYLLCAYTVDCLYVSCLVSGVYLFVAHFSLHDVFPFSICCISGYCLLSTICLQPVSSFISVFYLSDVCYLLPDVRLPLVCFCLFIACSFCFLLYIYLLSALQSVGWIVYLPFISDCFLPTS